MSRKFAVSMLCLGIAGGLLCVFNDSFVAAQQDDEQKAASEEAIQAYLKASEPGPEHAKLRMRVGRWNVAGTFYTAPGAPPMRSDATSNMRAVMGGRFVRENYTGEFMGQKFTGIGMYGYDKGLKKYVSTWMDSMSTSITRSEGTADESGNVITFMGEYFDPMRQEIVKSKYVLTLTSRRTHTAAMYEISADGSEHKTMELVYTRVKGGKADGDKKKAKEDA